MLRILLSSGPPPPVVACADPSCLRLGSADHGVESPAVGESETALVLGLFCRAAAGGTRTRTPPDCGRRDTQYLSSPGGYSAGTWYATATAATISRSPAGNTPVGKTEGRRFELSSGPPPTSRTRLRPLFLLPGKSNVAVRMAIWGLCRGLPSAGNPDQGATSAWSPKARRSGLSWPLSSSMPGRVRRSALFGARPQPLRSISVSTGTTWST